MNGILMTPENIRWTVEGLKTVTRRLSGLKEINKEPDKWRFVGMDDGIHAFETLNYPHRYIHIQSRYHVGETVYIKEAWATEKRYDNLAPSEIPQEAQIWYSNGELKDARTELPKGKLRSPMFLKAVSARYFIKILDVRPERLLSITPEDCIAEGIMHTKYWTESLTGTERQCYFAEWDAINTLFPSMSNPWLWVYRYERPERK